MEQTASRVLIVDDEPDIRTIVRILLSADGYEVLEAANGRQALEQLQNHTAVDLVLLDIMMPEMDGVTACQEIRKYSMAPILFLTAKSQESDKLQAYYSGGDDFLTKPFSKAELLMKVKSLLRRYQVYRGKHELEAYTKAGVVSLDGRSVYKDGQTIEVTETEAEIIRYLLEHRWPACERREYLRGCMAREVYAVVNQYRDGPHFKFAKEIGIRPSQSDAHPDGVGKGVSD